MLDLIKQYTDSQDVRLDQTIQLQDVRLIKQYTGSQDVRLDQTIHWFTRC